ncbi:MAG: cation:proton antiporter [Hydrococcus sp. Prado102]|nr:cation:proton antiporter [Hydrococcus sp. Prado102]
MTAWCLLALAIAVTRTNSIVGAFPTIIEAIIYIAFMATVVRWFLQKLSIYYRRTGRLSQFVLAYIYMGVVVSALITEFIGIHLIFGAFLLGAVMPKNAALVREIAEKTEDFVLIFLLPVFFAYSGLRTEIGLLNRPELWLLCASVVAIAIIGKYVGTYVAARASGIEKRDASALGWLMNTRGLTELIVLNIGLSFGVISPLLFTMLVIMALVTTFMTSPLLELTYPKEKIKLDIIEEQPEEIDAQSIPAYKILVPVANPGTQKRLLDLAVAIAGNYPDAVVHPLSLIELEEDYLFQSTPDEAERLIRQRREELETLIQTQDPSQIETKIAPIVRISNDVARETTNIALVDKASLIVVGWHRSTFSISRLGGRVGKILNTSPVDVAVFIDNRQKLDSLLVAHSDNIHDALALSLAFRLLINNPNRTLKILRFTKNTQENDDLSYELRNMLELLPQETRSRIELIRPQESDPIRTAVRESRNVDLTIAGTSPAWGIERQTLGRYTDRLSQECQSSLLITRRYSRVIGHITSLVNSEQNSIIS